MEQLLDLEISSEEHRVSLTWVDRLSGEAGDTRHESVEGAIHQAWHSFGIGREEWRESSAVATPEREEYLTLYRPVGPVELELVRASGFLAWPPRLPEQPYFYPVSNEQYAAEIASRWNVAESGYGAVMRFRVRAEFMARYEPRQVGGRHHSEWWVPAEDLAELNANIAGRIELLSQFGRLPGEREQ